MTATPVPPVPGRAAALGRLASARLSEAAFSAGWAAAQALPEPAVRALARAGADAATRRRGPGVRRLAANLARVLAARSAGGADPADLAATTRAGVRSYARYWTEVFRLPATPPDVVLDRFHCADEHLLRDALASGRGTILALAHSGNWDHAGAWATLTGMPFTTVAERLEPASLFDRFVAFRESLGMEVLPLGRPRLFSDLADRLRAGGTLCLLADRDLSATGVEVDLFGAPARVPAGPALLALRTGAVLLPVSVWYGWEGGPVTRARIHPAVPPPPPGGPVPRAQAMTQAVLDALATGPDGIADHPEDWHMLQRLWVDDLAAPRPLPSGVPA